MNEKSIAKTGWFYEFLVWLGGFGCRFVFHSIKYYFPNDKEMIEVSHPIVAFANHVDERDVPLLASVHQFLEPKSRYSMPIRRDMMEKNFLSKEFKVKGILKFLIIIIDRLHILPGYFKIIGAIPVARPFRDDTKELMRAGKLRDIVNEQWEDLLGGILKGRKLFLFPEGTFTTDGYIGPIRKGIFYLQEKISGLNLLPITLTYDYLLENKPIAHVGFGDSFLMKSGLKEQEVASIVKNKISKTFTLTPANLFSYSILSDEARSGIGRHYLFYKMKKMTEELDRRKLLYISRDLLNRSYEDLFAVILSNAKHSGYIELLENKKYKGAPKLYTTMNNPELTGKRKLKKINPYLYHSNQLRGIHEELIKIWREIEVYD